MINNFTKDDIFIMIFTSSRSSDYGEQICTVISLVSTNLPYRVEEFVLLNFYIYE